MVPQKELELKFEVEPSALRLLNKIQPIKALNKRPVQTAEASVYFDTDKHKLHKKGLLLRVRRIGKRHVQTIKATGNSAASAAWPKPATNKRRTGDNLMVTSFASSKAQ